MDAIFDPLSAYIDPSWFNYVLIILGLGLLFVGGDGLIRGAVALATRLGLSRLVIGLTIVGMGTSAPELMVVLQSALKGAPDMAMGNVVGSNIANILLIMGVGALLAPMKADGWGIRRDLLVMLAASISLLWLARKGTIVREDGLVMLAVLGAYLLIVYVWERFGHRTEPVGPDEALKSPVRVMHPVAALIWVGLGLVMLVVGADALVRGATHVARDLGLSEAVIGLTLVAVGTSLPELTVTIIAAIRRQGEVSLGNLIGSNIFNILGIIGVTACLSPLSVAAHMARVDVPLALGVALLLTLIILIRRTVGRLSGLLFLGLYAAYMSWLFVAS